MTPHQFWDEDPDLLFAYQQAYINKIHKQAHINGLYNNLAFSIALSNAFREKNTKVIEFPKEDVFNPFTQKKEKKETYLSSLDTSENNNQLFQIKKILGERRKNE